MKLESLVNWDVASFWKKLAEPFDMRTVEEAPVAVRPVPPEVMPRAEPRTMEPRLAWPETVRAVVEAYGKTEAVVEVAI